MSSNLIVISSQFGNTPLHQAVENGNIEVVRLLLLSQANMKIKNNVSTAISSLRAIMLHYLIIMVHGVKLNGSAGWSVKGRVGARGWVSVDSIIVTIDELCARTIH